jgi:hypothetical protein
MSGPGQIGPKGPELALAEAHLGYLNNAKAKFETKVINCERVISILRSHLEHSEKKNASQILPTIKKNLMIPIQRVWRAWMEAARNALTVSWTRARHI